MRLLVVLCMMGLLLGMPFPGAAWDLGSVLTEHLTTHFPWPRIEVRDIVCGEPLPHSLPETISIEKGPPGKTSFFLEFSNGRRIRVSAEVRALDSVVMTVRPFGKGHTFEKEDLYVKLTDVQKIPKNAVGATADVEGRQLTRSVIANAPVTTDMMRNAQSVRKGKRVMLVVDAPGFRITTKGETQENALVGDHVKVANQSTKKTVTGILVDDATVKVDF